MPAGLLLRELLHSSFFSTSGWIMLLKKEHESGWPLQGFYCQTRWRNMDRECNR